MPAAPRRRAAMTALFRAFNPDSPGMMRRLGALPRMIKASLKGEYDGGQRLLTMVAASIYIVSPIDLIPELFTFVFGLIDDAVVIAWLVGALLSETERFLEWEKANGRGPCVVVADVIEG